MPQFDDPRQFWNERYADAGYIFGTAPNRFLEAEAGRLPPSARILDVACGEGRNAVWLAERGHDVVGLDISPLALEKARRLAAERGVTVRFEEADLRTRALGEAQFDAIACIFIQFAAPEVRARLFEGFALALKPGGLLLMQGYTPKQLEFRTGGPGTLENLYTPEMLREAFADWRIERLESYEAELSEGTKHVGMSALVDLVARRPA
jgi:SAM-dependent methyltransferase